MTIVSRLVGATVEAGNAIGRSGNTEAAVTAATDVAAELARGGSHVLKQLTEALEQDITPIATALRAKGGYQLVVGIRGIRGSDVYMKAVANEFGTKNIPERSFIRATLDRNRRRYMRMLRDALDESLDGTDIREAMSRVGAQIVGDIQDYMTELDTPPNAPATVRAKGSANPLIDTGQLRASIDFTVLGPGED